MQKSFEIEFFDAVENNDLCKVRELLNEGGDVNANLLHSGWTALHCAAQRGYKEMARLLLAFNANVNAKTNSDKTPLHIAAMNGYTELAELLLDHHAVINTLDSSNLTPLKWAVTNKHIPAAELLRQRGSLE